MPPRKKQTSSSEKLTVEDLRDRVNALVRPGIMKLGSDIKFAVEYLPTGIVPVDYRLNGGLPRGRHVEIFGDYSTLKTLIALSAAAKTQAAGGIVAYIDTEKTFDKSWAANIGVDVDSLLIEQPESGEIAVDTAEVLLRGGVDLLVFDSVAGLLPRAEQEVKLSEKNIQPARQAALMSAALRKLTAANQHNTAILWINQLRMNIGVTFGNPDTTPGGKALGFYSSIRLNIRKAGRITRDIKVFDGEVFRSAKETHAYRMVITVDKSKLDRPHSQTYFVFDLDNAVVDNLGFMVSLALEKGIVVKNGAMWSFDKKTVRGREEFLRTVDQEKLEMALNLNGQASQPSRQGSNLKPVQSSSGAGKAIPGRVRAKSSGTGLRLKNSSKSKRPKSPSGWDDL